MAYQVTTRKSYGQRLSESIKGVGAGILLFFCGTILLFWNEGNFVKTRKSIKEAEKVLIEVGDISSIDPTLNGQLIHASAFADVKETLVDGTFGVSETAIAIRRQVEYLQYIENSESHTRDLIGGGEETVTTYTYDIAWTSAPVNSQQFSDPSYRSSNNTLIRVDDNIEYSRNVAFGAYRLPLFIIEDIELISESVPVQLSLKERDIARLEQTVQNRGGRMVHVQGNVIYFGRSPSNPAVGDVRVTFVKTPPMDVSIMAMVKGDTFDEYPTSGGRKFSMVVIGQASAEEMFEEAHLANEGLRILLLLLGVIAVMFGLNLMFSILPTLFKVLPFLGNIVGIGVGLVCFILGGAWSLMVISIAWLFYRPLIGLILLAIAFAGIRYLKKRGSNNKNPKGSNIIDFKDGKEGKDIREVKEVNNVANTRNTAPLFCTNCGAPIQTGALFCSGCGKKI